MFGVTRVFSQQYSFFYGTHFGKLAEISGRECDAYSYSKGYIVIQCTQYGSIT